MKTELEILKIIGENIKQYRVQKCMQIKDLANLTGIRKEYIARIEKVLAVGIKTSQIFKISHALNIPAHKLVEY